MGILLEPGMTLNTGVEDGKQYWQTSQDCNPIAEHAQALSSMGFEGPSKDMKFAASIPKVMLEKYLNDNNLTWSEFSRDQRHMSALLNDPALAAFRIWKGRV